MTRVLVVDGDLEQLDSARRLLERYGYRVDEASTVQQAIAALSALRPDVVVIDPAIEHPEGAGMIEWTRNHPDLTHVAVILASATPVAESLLRRFGMTDADCVEKPFVEPAFGMCVQRHLTSDRRMVEPRAAGGSVDRGAELHTLPPAPPEHHVLLGGRYWVDALVGEGAIGKVFEATDVMLGRTVAVKVLSRRSKRHPRHVRRLVREGRAAATLDHPNICRVFDLGWMEDGSPFVVMERLVGEPLSAFIRTDRALRFSAILTIVGDILAGLRAAHEKGVLHRDVKPDNVFLAIDSAGVSTVKLLDFGFARFLDASSESSQRLLLGTPFYMAPERLIGEGFDARTDLYATAVILHELITGRPAFCVDDFETLRKLVMERPFPDPRLLRRDTPDFLAQIVAKGTHRDPDQRFQSAAEFAAAVRSAKSRL